MTETDPEHVLHNLGWEDPEFEYDVLKAMHEYATLKTTSLQDKIAEKDAEIERLKK